MRAQNHETQARKRNVKPLSTLFFCTLIQLQGCCSLQCPVELAAQGSGRGEHQFEWLIAPHIATEGLKWVFKCELVIVMFTHRLPDLRWVICSVLRLQCRLCYALASLVFLFKSGSGRAAGTCHILVLGFVNCATFLSFSLKFPVFPFHTTPFLLPGYRSGGGSKNRISALDRLECFLTEWHTTLFPGCSTYLIT